MILTEKILKWNIYLIIVLNYGFINVGLPIGFPFPVFYIPAFLFLIFNRNYNLLFKFIRNKYFLILLPLIMVWLLHFITKFSLNNPFVIRDGTIVIDLFFLLVGYLYFYKYGYNNLYVDRFIKTLFLISTIYICFFPFREFIFTISPIVGIFNNVYLLGNYKSLPYIAIATIFYHYGKRKILSYVIISINLIYLFLAQSRVVLIVLLFFLPLFILFFRKDIIQNASDRRKNILYFSLFLGIGIFILILIPTLGIVYEGRHGVVSLDLIKQQFLSMVGRGELEGPAAGYDLRLNWWDDLLAENFASPELFVLGRGLGMPLTDFYTPSGVVVREPHNSYLTAFLRFGIIGFISFLLFHITLLWSVGAILFKSNSMLPEKTIFIFYISTLFNANFQPVFEFSSYAVPIYFFCGLFIILISRRKGDKK